MRKKAVKICILFIFITSLSVMSYVLYMKYRMEYNPDDLDTFFDEDNVVELSQDIMDKLYKCETYNEAIKIIGKANRVTGSGFFIVGYDTFEGRELNLTLDVEEENGKIVNHKIIKIFLRDKYKADTDKYDDKQGKWDEKKEVFTSAGGVNITSDEYEKLKKKLPDESVIDILTESMVDTYLYRTNRLKLDLLEKQFYEVSFDGYFEIYYFDFDVSVNGFDYKVIAKAALEDSQYENIKREFLENQDYAETTKEKLTEMLSDGDIRKIRDLDSFTIYMKSIRLTTESREGDNKTDMNILKAAMFCDATKEIYLYYYNPIMNSEQ